MAEPIVSEDPANPLDQLSPLERPRAVLQWLQQGHQRFLEGHSLHPHSTRERMRAVVEGQHPLAAVLGCADSRVPVELLFDSGFGDLFVVRNAGTMSTTAAIASLEYAVGHLDVPLIVVLGHEACGAVSAALHPELLLTPNLAQVVGQLRMELLQFGDRLDGPGGADSLPRPQLNGARSLAPSGRGGMGPAPWACKWEDFLLFRLTVVSAPNPCQGFG